MADPGSSAAHHSAGGEAVAHNHGVPTHPPIMVSPMQRSSLLKSQYSRSSDSACTARLVGEPNRAKAAWQHGTG